MDRNSDEIVSALGRIEQMLAALVKLQACAVLEKELADETDRKLYELTGSATSRAIQKTLKIGQARISATWARWERMGLLIKKGRTYNKVV